MKKVLQGNAVCVPLQERKARSIPETCALYGIGRASVLRIAKESDSLFKIGRINRIISSRFDAYIANHAE